MPKRKRDQHGYGARSATLAMEDRRRDVEQGVVQGKKLLNRALKTAKGFEWQKLGKRTKLAAEKDDAAEMARLQRELNALKNMDLPTAVETHLYKGILKSKTIAESGLLPEYVKIDAKKPEGSEEEILAQFNVAARLYNMKPVKECMTNIMAVLYAGLGLPNPATDLTRPRRSSSNNKNASAEVKAEDSEDEMPKIALNTGDDEDISAGEKGPSNEPAWDGFESTSESERLSRYDGLLGSSSESGTDGDDDSDNEIQKPSTAARRTIQSRELSVSVSSQSPSPPPPERAKRVARTVPQPSKLGSTFLPTLMGGYWSGSEESATDDEGVNAPPRKNRPGQQARRAIWEKKFGIRANHLKNQTNAKSRDADWDPKRGARGSDERVSGRGASGGGARGRRGFVRSRELVTGENAIAVQPRARGMGRKDDSGKLHPSWEAKKKAKEMMKPAKFEGKKVVFD